jgi:hypothetical protein
VETKAPIWFEASALVKAKGSYYAGGALADSGSTPSPMFSPSALQSAWLITISTDVTWTVSSTSGTFAPPGFQDFKFTCAEQLVLAQPTQLACQRVLKGKTRESGEHKVLIQFKVCI